MQEEQHVMALESASHYEVSENLLRIWFENGAALLVFQTLSPIDLTPSIQPPVGNVFP